MAVVQISRVQVRRGRKNTGSSLPQLASGELGWAVDTQELYVGNGSVAEGAPYVGNTKIITEHDNIFDLVGQYIYRRTDPIIQTGFSYTTPVARSLQERLDDSVSVRAFGVTNDTDFDQSPEDRFDCFQRAIDNLFLNIDSTIESSRVTLYIDPGVYTISEALRIPPFATIRGAGKDKTVIRQVGDAPVIKSVGTRLDGFEIGDYFNFETGDPDNIREQPKYISLSGITLQHTKIGYPLFEMYAVKESVFEDIKFVGTWERFDSLTTTNTGLEMIAISGSSLRTCETNVFKNCEFTNISYGIRSKFDIIANNFENCLFHDLGLGIDFGYELQMPEETFLGPRYNRISTSRFFDIDQEAIVVGKGLGNLSENNVFENVGGTSATASYSVIRFQDSSNVSTGDYFQRSADLSPVIDSQLSSSDYLGEYAGAIRGEHRYNITLSPTYTETSAILFRLSGYTNLKYKVHYLYKSTSANIVRNGVLYITADRSSTTVRLSDEYDSTGNFAISENLRFTAEFDQNLSNTINISYTNLTVGDTCELLDGFNICASSFSYWYEVIS
jgi:hypothetical protein